MPHELRHERRPDYTSEVTLGAAPDGSLQFEDGTATVPGRVLAEAIADRYVAISYAGAVPDGDAEEDGGDASGEDFSADAFVDRTPMEDVVQDLESGEYDAHLDAIEGAADRQGVQDAIADRRED